MKISEKISLLKKTIQEIKKISTNLNHETVSQANIRELNQEIKKLKEGISENVEELEKIIEEENARY
tara:strand:+ start:82 stop:282 length:201 start_codon:yes stop_codon:yes gene_type:complete